MYKLSYKGKAFGESMGEERAMAMADYLKPCFLNLEIVRTAQEDETEQASEQVSA